MKRFACTSFFVLDGVEIFRSVTSLARGGFAKTCGCEISDLARMDSLTKLGEPRLCRSTGGMYAAGVTEDEGGREVLVHFLEKM